MSPGNAEDVIGKSVGNYVIERALARGGMGSVFVARHRALGREAAVKFLGHDFEAPPELTTRFLAEARITANLRHPNIIDIFDFGELDGRLYYVMELLQGYDLSEFLRRFGKLSVIETIDILAQVAAGLAAAHGVGVVHRDLKPANVFVLEGVPRRVKLMDFGIAKVLSTAGSQTTYGQIMGTPRYMSPEQAVGDAARVSPQSDIYSLGVIAYEMLTGTAPFEHESPVMLLIMHVRDQICPVSERRSECPPELAKLVEACLSKEPESRPRSATEVLETLETIRKSHHSVIPLDSRTAVNTDSVQLRRPIEGSSFVDDDTLRNARPLNDEAMKLDIRDAPSTTVANDAKRIPPEPTPWTPPRGSTNPPFFAATHTPEVDSAASVTPQKTAAHHTELNTSSPKQVTESTQSQGTTAESLIHADAIPIAPEISDQEAEALALGLSDVTTEATGPIGHTAKLELSDGDRNVLNKLVMRMQRRGDFPAFVQNIGEVSKRSEVQSCFSAEQLGSSILKDYALTAKLLRIVNSAYANRFGGKVYSVQHAIVILGFDRVRQLALAISLFKNQENKTHDARMTESAINSLVSSEISRELCYDAEVDDPEQAVVCSMFRNLGRHLVLVYLPEMYDQIVALMKREHLSANNAAERVLGISMHKIGVGIAERWRLPQRIIQAMAVIPERTGRLYREEDRISALAEFSNQLCEIVSSNLRGTMRENALNALTNKHKHLVALKADDLADLLVRAQDSFEKRYASVLGNSATNCRFSSNVLEFVEEAARNTNNENNVALSEGELKLRTETIASSKTVEPNIEIPLAVPAINAEASPAFAASVTNDIRGPKAKRPIARLQLAKTAILSQPPADKTDFEQHVAEIKSRFTANGATETLMSSLLKALAETLQVSRIILLKATTNQRELIVHSGFGDDIGGLCKELRFPLSPSRSATDPFSLAYHVDRTQSIEDCFANRVMSSMPPRYYEVIGATSLVLAHVPCKVSSPFVLCVIVDPPNRLPTKEQLQTLEKSKELVGQVATGLART
jgi:serine/threonine protein kinase/HD-like signal output (HDOD) protein